MDANFIPLALLFEGVAPGGSPFTQAADRAGSNILNCWGRVALLFNVTAEAHYLTRGLFAPGR